MRLTKARRVLEKMQKQLARMTAAHVAAEEHLSELTVDEASVETVVRDSRSREAPHMLRNACGYALANRGTNAPTRTLQAYLGYRSIQSTVPLC